MGQAAEAGASAGAECSLPPKKQRAVYAWQCVCVLEDVAAAKRYIKTNVYRWRYESDSNYLPLSRCRSHLDCPAVIRISVAHGAGEVQVQRANEHSEEPAPEKGVPQEYRAVAEVALRTKGTAMNVEAELIDMARRNNKPATSVPTRKELTHFKKGLSRQDATTFSLRSNADFVEWTSTRMMPTSPEQFQALDPHQLVVLLGGAWTAESPIFVYSCRKSLERIKEAHTAFGDEQMTELRVGLDKFINKVAPKLLRQDADLPGPLTRDLTYVPSEVAHAAWDIVCADAVCMDYIKPTKGSKKRGTWYPGVYVNSKRTGIAVPITKARVQDYMRGVAGVTADSVTTRAEFRAKYSSLHLVELDTNGAPVLCDCKGFWVKKVCAHLQAAKHALQLIDLAAQCVDVAPNSRRGRPRRTRKALEQQPAE